MNELVVRFNNDLVDFTEASLNPICKHLQTLLTELVPIVPTLEGLDLDSDGWCLITEAAPQKNDWISCVDSAGTLFKVDPYDILEAIVNQDLYPADEEGNRMLYRHPIAIKKICEEIIDIMSDLVDVTEEMANHYDEDEDKPFSFVHVQPNVTIKIRL